MQEPELPDDEAARIATLRSLNILDTPREDQYDRFTRISTRIFDMPIAVISLVDRYRQWFKSAEGLEADETPRSVSFCGHAILGNDVFEVRNALRDPRFRDNPLVVDQPHIRFYAGAPLEAPNGHKLGTLCLIDKVPRRLSDEEKVMLKNLANMVVAEMVNNVDTDTGLANRHALLAAGTACFAKPAAQRRFSLHLFDISGAETPQQDDASEIPPGETFGRLLTSFYPNARAAACLGGSDFCVLLERDESFDERRAVNHLCAAAKTALAPANGGGNFAAFVGIVQYDPNKHITFDDVIRDVDAMFQRREKAALPEMTSTNPFVNAWLNWRNSAH